ncbi:MAG TPA: hypothetical protein VJA94_06290, partial [Candidatus Angelobacter sp.]
SALSTKTAEIKHSSRGIFQKRFMVRLIKILLYKQRTLAERKVASLFSQPGRAATKSKTFNAEEQRK